jgi:hypothetical protein
MNSTLRSSNHDVFAYLPVRFSSVHNGYWNRMLPPPPSTTTPLHTVPHISSKSSQLSSASVSYFDSINEQENNQFMNQNHTDNDNANITTHQSSQQHRRRHVPVADSDTPTTFEELRSGPAGGQPSSLQRLLQRSLSTNEQPLHP